MKNKIFELYKPKSLEEFLKFKKENPEETFVYVLQHPPENINILSASNFGYLVICLPQLSQIVFSTGPFVFKMRKKTYRTFVPRIIFCAPVILLLLAYQQLLSVISLRVNLIS